jgi:uncharacterized protein (TIGR03437 family)
MRFLNGIAGLLGLAASLNSPKSFAAGTLAPPIGIFCSCGPTTPRSHSLATDIAALNFVAGVLVRVSWSDLESVEGQYNWSLLDSELTLAHEHGKRVALGIVNGASAPAWLKANGAEMFTTTFRGSPSSIPVPWDPVYLSAWSKFVVQLGARYRDHPDIALVHMTHSTANGFEMQLPFGPADIANWQKVGYTVDKEIASWKAVMDAFRQAFPGKPLDVEVHPVLNSDEVAKAVVDYGYATIGARFGVFSAWWSRHNATSVYPGMYDLIVRGAARSYSTVQFVDNQTQTPTFSLSDAITFALSSGVRYMEVWNQDLLNPALRPLLTSTAVSLTERSVATASAATWVAGSVAAGSLAVASGVGLAGQTASASVLPLSTDLGGTTLTIKDAAGTSFAAALSYVSPTQINFVVPGAAAQGTATVLVENVQAGSSSGTVQIKAVQPGIFTANQDGSGVPSAYAVVAKPDGSQTTQAVYECPGGAYRCSAIPVDIGGAGDTAVLILYGTGVRNRASLAGVSASIGGLPAQVTYAEAGGGSPGLDQINVRIPATLAGRGLVEVVITIDGVAANPVTVWIR